LPEAADDFQYCSVQSAAAGWVLPVEQASAVAQVFVEPVPAVVLQVVPVELGPAGLVSAVGPEPVVELELAVELEPAAGLVFVVDVQVDFPAEQVQAVAVDIEQAVVAESLVVV